MCTCHGWITAVMMQVWRGVLSKQFDLVVTDFNMPLIPGLIVAHQLIELRPGLPVLISSGYISEALRVDAAEMGVRAVLQKEHTFEELGAAISVILNPSL